MFETKLSNAQLPLLPIAARLNLYLSFIILVNFTKILKRLAPAKGTSHGVMGCATKLNPRLPSPFFNLSSCFNLSRSLNAGIDNLLQVVGHGVT